jgi:predicted Zn finger-like uncharacterized protein
MKLICPQCETAYDVTPTALGAHGRQVRCARCKTLWDAEPPLLAANVIPLIPQDASTEAAVVIEPGDVPAAAREPEAADPAPAAEAERPPEVHRRARRPAKPAWRSHALGAAIFLLMALNIALILGREQVVRALPQTASLFETIGLPVNLRNLAFREIKTTEELHDGVAILLIEGKIVATGHEPADVPRLRFSIGAANGHEIYAWTALPARTKLAPGEALPFRTRLASPPEQGRFVKVRFFTRYDLASGLR